MSTTPSARNGRARSLAVSAWPLRYKVGLAIAIPTLLAITLGLLQVRSDLQEASNASTSARQVTVLPPAIDYLTAAETAMVAAQDPTEASADDLEASVRELRRAADDLSVAAANADLTAEQRYQVDALLDLSQAIRQANTDTLSSETWIAQLRQLQSGVTQLITSIVNAQDTPEPQLELLSQTLAGRFSLAMQQALAQTTRAGDTGSLELFAELGVESAAIDRLAGALGESEPAIAALRTDNAQRARAVRTGSDDLGGADAYTEYDTLATSMLDGIDTELADSAADARRSALLSGALVLFALLATILLAILISRMMLNPIRKVREGARTVAHEELPEAVARIRAGDDPGPITPIDVTTHEEIGQLARAVDDLHEQAVTLASGEARLREQVSEMFITLSRRNTSLVNQQLALIESLEKDEEDPRRLESLFRLDHLAARMRRTGDSLLVLADAPTHSAEENLRVVSAMQAATAGVQDYRRVRVGTASTALISDTAAADVVHILTELVDNALAFSPPTSTVLLSSTADAGGVTIEIEDSGIGITDDELAQLNLTLRRGAEVTPDTARRMGLFVVSRLAQRHGIQVSLKRNRANGITAGVRLPSSILDPSTPAGPTVAPPMRTVEPPPAPRPAPAMETLADASALPQRAPASAPGVAAVPAAADAPAAVNGEPLSLEERLNAAMGRGLPQRQPGAQSPMDQLAPSALEPQQAPAMASDDVPVPEDDTAAEPGADVPALAAVADVPALAAVADEPFGTTDADERYDAADQPAALDEPLAVDADQPAASDEPAAEDVPVPALAAVADEPALSAVDPEPALPPTAAAYAAASDAPLPAASTLDPLTGELPAFPPVGDSEAEADTPIFKALRSAWLSADSASRGWGSSEVEEGWARADQVADTTPEAPMTTPAGLPVRRPGTRLVPGGVAKPAAVGARDPESIRARLAAHAAGVSRGRADASHDPSEDGPA